MNQWTRRIHIAKAVKRELMLDVLTSPWDNAADGKLLL
jgi:hypothetical protein